MGAILKARAVAAFSAMLILSSAAMAQQGDGPINCDANLNPRAETEMEREQRVICETHAGCRMVSAVVRASCRASEFFSKLAKREDPNAPITSNEVIDAATPDYPASARADRIVESARNAGRMYPGTGAKSETVTAPDGRTVYLEARPLGSSGGKKGSAIYSDGSAARGDFTADLRLNGQGQKLAANGKMQAGSYLGGKPDSSGGVTSIETFKEPDGRTSMLEGVFCDDSTPCSGEMIRRYSDGTSVREIWSGGKMVRRGEIGQKGEPPPKFDVALRAAPEQPIWTPAQGEGLRTIGAREDEERIVLWCNERLVEEGAPAPKGKALPPVRRTCRQQGPDGVKEFTDIQGRRRLELWCKGKIVDDGGWYPKGHMPRMPERQSCSPPSQLAQADDDGDEIEQKDAIQRTLGPGKMRPTGRFPCALNGQPVMAALQPCIQPGRGFSAEDRNAIIAQCGSDYLAYLNLAYRDRGPDWIQRAMVGNTQQGMFIVPAGARMSLDIPWGQIRPDMLVNISMPEVRAIGAALAQEAKAREAPLNVANSAPGSFEAMEPVLTCIAGYAIRRSRGG